MIAEAHAAEGKQDPLALYAADEQPDPDGNFVDDEPLDAAAGDDDAYDTDAGDYEADDDKDKT